MGQGVVDVFEALEGDEGSGGSESVESTLWVGEGGGGGAEEGKGCFELLNGDCGIGFGFGEVLGGGIVGVSKELGDRFACCGLEEFAEDREGREGPWCAAYGAVGGIDEECGEVFWGGGGGIR